MKKDYMKAMSSAIVMSLVLTSAMPVTLVKAAKGQVTRVGEDDSYATAAKVATTNWISSNDVVLVCGEGYADAVSATVLAKQLNAPILLTTAGVLNGNAKIALDTLKPQNIYIIGGTASISKVVRDGLKNSNYNLIELGGKDRYETNIAVANQLVKLGVKADDVMLVSGEGFSDILSVTSVAASKEKILLLGTNSSSSMKPVLDFVKSNNSKVTVVGTSHSINESTYKALRAIKRVNGGADRFETNLNVLGEFGNDLKTDKIFIANASGDRYTDALIASSLAGKSAVPLVLVDTETSSATDKAISYIKNKIGSATDLNVIGGAVAVSDNIISKINSVVPTEDSSTVKSVSTNGLNQVKIEFNTKVDKDTAELLKNYEIDGASLNNISDTYAAIQDDNRTVLITFSKPFDQYKEVNFKVTNSILDKKQSNNIAKFEQKITFSDISVPVLESVTARGGNKLIVKFSKPIRISSDDLSTMKINRQSLSNFGLSKSMTTFRNKAGAWSDGVELYFNSPLPTGSNTFSIPNGEANKKFDNAAGFPLKGTTLSFSVESVTGMPRVTNITGDSYNVYITYDRAMDKKTALEDSNYKINGSSVYVSSSDILFDEGSNDEVVRIKGVNNLLKSGENEVTVNDDVEDTYGNNINETKMKFSIGNDSIKPQVTSVSVIDSKTLRIKFNKDVISSDATNKSNYKLVDSDGTEITYKIDKIQAVYDADRNSKKTYDIIFKDNNALKGWKYTLTVKNIVDTNSASNVMDSYTTVFSGLDESSPKVTSIIKKSGEQSVVIFFDKAMDEDSLLNPENYYYKDGRGDKQKLPVSSNITLGVDDKSVIIDFPSSYTLGNGVNEIAVIRMGIVNVKDKNGNLLETVYYCDKIGTDYNDGPSLIDNTSKITYEGDDIKVKSTLTAPLDTLDINDFKVNGRTPDSGVMIGNDIILTFKAGVDDNEKINAIKNAGDSVTLGIYGTNSTDSAGRKLKSASDTIILPPTTLQESWVAKSNISSGTNSTVDIVFNQNIDDDIQNLYFDDFTFINETTGERLNALSAYVNGRSVIYKFNNGSIKVGDRITVRANDQTANISIRNDENKNGNYAVYCPSKDDLKGRTLIAK